MSAPHLGVAEPPPRQSSRARILWNRRPESSWDGGDIDEIVIHHPNTVHIEQMNERCWMIAIATPTGEWIGNFVTDSQGRMSFFEQENDGVLWERDESHDLEDEHPSMCPGSGRTPAISLSPGTGACACGSEWDLTNDGTIPAHTSAQEDDT